MKTKGLIVIFVLVVGSALIGFLFGQNRAGDVFSINEANDKAMNFINEVLLGGQSTASLVDISEEHGLIKIDINIEGQPYTSYMTRDTQLFFPEGMNIEEYTQLAQSAESQEIEAPSEDVARPSNLNEFISCLAEANLVIYGADWCGYTTALIDSLGGYEIVDPIYVECTQEQELCSEKEIAGYPTILLAGQIYQGGRTPNNLSEATGCNLVY